MKTLTVEAFIPLLFLLWSVFWMLQFLTKIIDLILHPQPFIIVRGRGDGEDSGDSGWGDSGCGDGGYGDGGCDGGGGDGGDGGD